MERLKEDVYEAPKLEIVKLCGADIVTASGDIDDNLSEDTWQP